MQSNVSANKVMNSYGLSCQLLRVRAKKTHLGGRQKHGEWQKCGRWRKETSNGRKRWGMLSKPLRGQVWTTIKTEFHWQPSGNNSHITRKGRDICGHPQPCAHMKPHTQIFTYTHAQTQQHLYEHAAGVKQTNYAVMLQLNWRLEGHLKWIMNTIIFPSILDLPVQLLPQTQTQPLL